MELPLAAGFEEPWRVAEAMAVQLVPQGSEVDMLERQVAPGARVGWRDLVVEFIAMKAALVYWVVSVIQPDLRERYWGPILEHTARLLASASGAPDQATYVRWLAGVLGEYSEALVEAGAAGRDPTHAFVNVTERRIGTNPHATPYQKVVGGASLVAFVQGTTRRIAASFVEAGSSRIPAGDPPALPDHLERAAKLAATLRPAQGCAVLFVALGLAGVMLGWAI